MYKVGDLVRYIHEDSAEDKATGYYPPIGTIGRVVMKGENESGLVIKWPEGTTAGGGYVRETDVEGVVNCGGWLITGRFDDFAKCPHCGQYDYPLFEALYWTFCPYCGERIRYDES